MQKYRLPLIREVPIPSDEEASLPQPIAYYYLASDVDARIAELERELEQSKSLAISLDKSNERLRQKIDRLRA